MRLYRPMLKQALTISWRNKSLWFFGLFSALLTSGGAYNLGLGNYEKVKFQILRLNSLRNFFQHWSANPSFGSKLDIISVWHSVGIWGIFLMLIIIAAAIFLIWLVLVSQGALIFGLQEKVDGKTISFSYLFRRGVHKIWPVILINLTFNVVLIAVLLMLSLPFFILFVASVHNLIWQSILLVLSFLVWVPLAAILFIIIRYALFYAVNQDKHVGESLALAFGLFFKNWLVSLELALLLFILNIITGLILALIMIFVAIPFIMLAMIAVQISSSMFFWLVVTAGVFAFIIILFLYGALWTVFNMANWIILFNKIQAERVYSKIWRWAASLGGSKNKSVADKESDLNDN